MSVAVCGNGDLLGPFIGLTKISYRAWVHNQGWPSIGEPGLDVEHGAVGVGVESAERTARRTSGNRMSCVSRPWCQHSARCRRCRYWCLYPSWWSGRVVYCGTHLKQVRSLQPFKLLRDPARVDVVPNCDESTRPTAVGATQSRRLRGSVEAGLRVLPAGCVKHVAT